MRFLYNNNNRTKLNSVERQTIDNCLLLRNAWTIAHIYTDTYIHLQDAQLSQRDRAAGCVI